MVYVTAIMFVDAVCFDKVRVFADGFDVYHTAKLQGLIRDFFHHRSLSRFQRFWVVMIMKNTIALICALTAFTIIDVFAQVLPPVTVVNNTNPSPGALYISPNSRVTNPPYAPNLMVLGSDGTPVNSRFIPEYAFDFRVLADGRLGYSVFQSAGSGARASSSIYIVDTNLVLVDSLKGANAYNLAMHSFDVLPNGNRLVVMQENVTIDMSSIVAKGNPAASVQQMLLQEIDVDGNIIFQWRSLDHFPVTLSYEDLTAPSIRYFHLNAVTVDRDGHFLISGRHSSLIAKIHRKTGKVLWVLGGKLNQFTFSAANGITDDPVFSYQHDIVRLPNGNISMFDNGTQRTPQWSRAVEYQLDEINKTCTLVWQHRKSPDVYAGVQGAVQTLPNGNRVIAWGSALQNNQTLVTEVDVSNKEVYEIALPNMMYPYKAIKAPYPTGRNAASVLIDEILPTNTYTYTREKDTVGLTVTYHTLVSFFYNTTTARRYMWAPENPRFERIIDGKPVRTLAPYSLYPCRVTLTQEGMVDHAGEFRFSTDMLGITDPTNTVIYYRDTIGVRAFRPLQTRYNPNTRELVADTAMAGEFCFGVGVKDDADSISSPRLLSPIGGRSVEQQKKFNLRISPQGQAQYATFELRQPQGTQILISTDKQTDKESAPGLNVGVYYWRARSRYGTSTSEWSALDSFRVEGPFISITAPSSQSVWYHDSSYVVTWNTNITVPVKLELVNNKNQPTLVKDNLPGLQAGFLWKVPVSVSVDTGYVLRVSPMDTTLSALTQKTQFSIEIRAVPTSVQEEGGKPTITLGPNPVSTILYVGGQTPINRIMLFAADGALVVDRVVRGTGDMLDLSELSQGSYILRCDTPSGPVQRVVVVAR